MITFLIIFTIIQAITIYALAKSNDGKDGEIYFLKRKMLETKNEIRKLNK